MDAPIPTNDPPARGRPAGLGRGAGLDGDGVLELEALLAVDESRVGGNAVVGAGPRHEVQLTRLPRGPVAGEGIQQRRDDLGWD